MSRKARVAVTIALIAVIATALWALMIHPARQTGQQVFRNTVNSAITNPITFAKSHFTGGVGAALMANPTNGLLQINDVLKGSPAEQAGLKSGDIILEVNGISTRGKLPAQNVESIRGFVGGSVTLTVQRGTSTNLQFVIHRTSWNSMGIVPQ